MLTHSVLTGMVVAVLFVYFVVSITFINLRKDTLSFGMGFVGMLVSLLGMLTIMNLIVPAKNSGEKVIGELRDAAERENRRNS